MVPIAESVESDINWSNGGKARATIHEFRGTGFGAPSFGLRRHKPGSASGRLNGAKFAKDLNPEKPEIANYIRDATRSKSCFSI